MKNIAVVFSSIAIGLIIIVTTTVLGDATILQALAATLIVAVFHVVFILWRNRTTDRTMHQLNRQVSQHKVIMERKAKIEEKLVQETPTGILVLDDDFNIAFANAHAKFLFDNPLENKSLHTMSPQIAQAIKNKTLDKPHIYKIYEEYYEVHYDKEEWALFFYRVSEREKLKSAYEKNTTVIGVLHLDNFEDALSALDVQERNEIQGLFLGTLNHWAERYDIHLIPLNASKIYATMHKENLDQAIKDAFDIQNDIAHISKENDLFITLSGGIACANIPLTDLAKSAEEALEQALSRGGDQIAINIHGEDYLYFGGNTNTQEKRTRISSRINAKKLDMLFTEASKVFIMPHTHPDADALGSAIGVLKMALASKKEAYIVMDDEAYDKTVGKILTLMEYEYVKLLDYFITIDQAHQFQDKKSLLMLIDHHSYGQLIDERLLQRSEKIAIIDHHRKLTDAVENTDLSYIEPYASSSSELVVEMINVYPKTVELNPFEATILLSGIIVDTNNFMYRTGTRTFEAAAILRKFGADTYKIRNILRESLKEIQIKSELLSRAEVINKRFALVDVPNELEADRTMLARIADDLLEIDHVVAGFVIGNIEKNIIGISARSLEGFNVQTVMEQFGGGGHLNNAGAQLEDTDTETVKEQLIDVLDTLKQEGRPMKVILQKDVKNQGKKGEVVEVAPGFGNYLLTSKQAIEATPENLAIIEDEKQKQEAAQKQTYEEMKELKKRIDYRAVKVYVKIGKNGKLFGKINTKQIAEALQEQHGITIDKRKIQLAQSIDSLGTYEIEVKLHKDVTASFELLVMEQKDGR